LYDWKPHAHIHFSSKRTSFAMTRKLPIRLWLARLLIVYVLVVNVQCAVLFIAQPEAYAPGFELSGAAGDGMLRGMGILFLMWNVPYAVALSHPLKRRLSLLEAIAMQAIGFFGETLLLLSFPPDHPVISASVGRFILFDGIGLAALGVALVLISSPVPVESTSG
jgi:hypothetical protein